MNSDSTTYPTGTSEFQTRALGLAALTCVGFMLLGSLLGWIVPAEVDLAWYEGLVRPQPQPPDALVLAVALLYYPLFFVLLYRMLTRVDDTGARRTAVGLILVAMLVNTAWNPLLIGTRSIGLGVAGNGVLAAVVSLLVIHVRERDRLSAILLLPYVAWVIFELAWSARLLALNS